MLHLVSHLGNEPAVSPANLGWDVCPLSLWSVHGGPDPPSPQHRYRQGRQAGDRRVQNWIRQIH